MSGQLVPVHSETVIPDALSVLVYEEHVRLGFDPGGSSKAERLPVWVFASRGLESVGQCEVVLGILQVQSEQRPLSPFSLVGSIYRQAVRGNTLSDGTRFDLDGGRLDFDPRVSGFLCLHYPLNTPMFPAIDTDTFQSNPLLLVPVLPQELSGADNFGTSRVAALLAKHSTCHPFPWWHDTRRQSVLSAEGSESCLARLAIPRAHTPEVRVSLSGPRLNIVVATDECSRLQALLTEAPDNFVWLTGLDSDAVARLCWEPGQIGPSATIQGWRMEQPAGGDLEVAGNFLLLVHGDVVDDARVVEDGFAVMMSETTWRRFASALMSRLPFTCSTEPGGRVREVTLEFRPSR